MSLFKDVPSPGGAKFECEPGQYYVMLVGLEPSTSGQFGPGIKWMFQVMRPDGTTVLQEDGITPHLLWAFSNDRMGITPAGQKAKARRWLETLLGRELVAGERGDSFADEALGKLAQAYITSNGKGTAMVIGQMDPLPDKVKLRLEQLKAEGKLPKAVIPPPREPVGVGASGGANFDDIDIPF